MNNGLRRVYIAGSGFAVGEDVITNHDLEKMVDTSDEWIRTRTGIVERRVAASDVATSDLATRASLQALKQANISAEELDLIIVATITPDMTFPSTACLVQANLGAKNAAAFDLGSACSGFIYGSSVAQQFLATGMYDNALVIGAETMSSILDYEDRNTCVLFGDGAGAMVFKAGAGRGRILSSHLGADGTGGNLLRLPAGGSRLPASIETVQNREHYVKMEGSEVFKFAVRIMGQASLVALSIAGLEKADVDWLIPHQANMRIINAAARRLKLPMEKVIVNLDRFGNMSAASIPVALAEAIAADTFAEGDIVVLVGFGGGLTWGSMVLEW